MNQDWKNAISIYKRDGKKTESLNAGIPMSIIAGALKIQLEKINHYKLGDMYEHITTEKCKIALKITKIATIIFIIVIFISNHYIIRFIKLVVHIFWLLNR